MPRRTLVLISSIVLVLVLFASAFMTACSKSASPTPASGTTTTAPPPTTQAAKPITLVFSSHDPATGSWAEIYQPFFTEIETRTNGMVKFEQHWGGELSGFFEAYDAAAKATVDLAQSMPGMYPNLFPLEDVASIVSYDIRVLAKTQQLTELTTEFPEMQKAFTDSGTKLIFRVATFPNLSCMGKGKAVRSLADFKGKKYLSTGPWDAATWEALGMVPLSMMPDETFLNLQTGVCDGATLTLASLFDFGWGEVTPFASETNVRPGSFAMVMNLKKWNSLPAEYQKIIEEAAAKVPAAQDQQQLRFDRDLRPKATAQWGTEFIKFSAADLAKMNELTQPVKAKFMADLDAKGLPGTKLLNAALRLEKKYAGAEYALK